MAEEPFLPRPSDRWREHKLIEELGEFLGVDLVPYVRLGALPDRRLRSWLMLVEFLSIEVVEERGRAAGESSAPAGTWGSSFGGVDG